MKNLNSFHLLEIISNNGLSVVKGAGYLTDAINNGDIGIMGLAGEWWGGGLAGMVNPDDWRNNNIKYLVDRNGNQLSSDVTVALEGEWWGGGLAG